MPGVKISLGTAARGAALDGGSAAAVFEVERGRCGRAGLCSFSSFARKALGLFATDTNQDDVEVSAVGKAGPTAASATVGWCARTPALTGASGMKTLASSQALGLRLMFSAGGLCGPVITGGELHRCCQ